MVDEPGSGGPPSPRAPDAVRAAVASRVKSNALFVEFVSMMVSLCREPRAAPDRWSRRRAIRFTGDGIFLREGAPPGFRPRRQARERRYSSCAPPLNLSRFRRDKGTGRGA